jgi:hypothetical protein
MLVDGQSARSELALADPKLQETIDEEMVDLGDAALSKIDPQVVKDCPVFPGSKVKVDLASRLAFAPDAELDLAEYIRGTKLSRVDELSLRLQDKLFDNIPDKARGLDPARC